MGNVPCVITEYHATSITCTVYKPGIIDSNQKVNVFIWGAGLAINEDDVRWSWKNEISSFDAISGSFYGGHILKLNGKFYITTFLCDK